MMISLASIAKLYRAELEHDYGHQLQSVHYRALNKIIQCHTPQAGALLYHCAPCRLDKTLYPSCGHRHCPSCQHKTNSDWLARQQQKLLPVDYYLITFTVPSQLRHFVWTHQKWAYQAMFQAATQTLISFFGRDKQLGETPGVTGVLHTHSRKLDYHPHLHFVVPGGSLNKQKMLWQKKSGKYLFKADNLAKVFRGKLLSLFCDAGFYLPSDTPKEWNADCQFVGHGNGALTYLARYLYRGVIAEKNILNVKDGHVTYQYRNSKNLQYVQVTESAAKFLWRIIQHVLPKGFRRARDFGFLHGNAKRLLLRIQMLLKVNLPPLMTRQKSLVCCPQCQSQMDLCLMRIGNHMIVGSTR